MSMGYDDYDKWLEHRERVASGYYRFKEPVAYRDTAEASHIRRARRSASAKSKVFY